MIKSNQMDHILSSTHIGFQCFLLDLDRFLLGRICFWVLCNGFGSHIIVHVWQPNSWGKIYAFHEVLGNACLAIVNFRGLDPPEFFKYVHFSPVIKSDLRNPQLHILGERNSVPGVVRNLQVCRFLTCPYETEGLSRNLDQILDQWQDLDLGQSFRFEQI